MKTYKISSIWDDHYRYGVDIGYSKDKTLSSIYLPKNEATAKLVPGDYVTVLRDSYCEIEDLVYLYPGGMSFVQPVMSNDEFTCKLYVKNIQNLFRNGKMDRIAFKIALIKECRRRGKTPSLIAWRNLQNLYQM